MGVWGLWPGTGPPVLGYRCAIGNGCREWWVVVVVWGLQGGNSGGVTHSVAQAGAAVFEP
jgi:hypothetical protein